jgi:8-oxo-dGTP pyrophosphatase MutT (NUDIX family)
MVAGSILPITIHKNKLYFLFGKENPMEDSAKGWSDFGGRVDKGETPLSAALREGGEELTGFLGDDKALQKRIRSSGGTYNITHNKYHVHMFYMEYDENLPKYYNQNHDFLWKRMDKTVLNDTKLFEKIKIDWFSVEQMQSRKEEFRGFYQEIVDKFLEQSTEIRKFAEKKRALKRPNRSNKTQRKRDTQM